MMNRSKLDAICGAALRNEPVPTITVAHVCRYVDELEAESKRLREALEKSDNEIDEEMVVLVADNEQLREERRELMAKVGSLEVQLRIQKGVSDG